MIKSASLALILVCSVALQAASRANPVAAKTFDLEQLMPWLPADTETVTVARGPFALAGSASGENETRDRVISDKNLSRNFEELPLALLGLKNGLLAKRLEGKRIDLAIEGARHFRPPTGLGEMPYEGCAIAVFSEDLHAEIASFAKDARTSVLKVERIENQDVSVFQRETGARHLDVFRRISKRPRGTRCH